MSQPPEVNTEALKSEIRSAVINRKANACPMTLRIAWHAAGTYDKNTGTGGTNGATMRFDPEMNDPANAGLGIIRSMLHPISQSHPEISTADVWAFAGCAAVEFLGGPKIPFKFGRTDAPNGSLCPPNGRLPDASKGADHIREVFYRMGFNDREIVALIGAHTLGRCHLVRSGFDGPWTRNPLKFDNAFFKNLMFLEWRPRQWDGPLQYEDVETGELMMLPTDMALRTDPKFRVYAELYAKDEQQFFKDFADAFAKLVSLGTKCDPNERTIKEETPVEKASAEFREAAMHGSLSVVKKYAATADVHAVEKTSGRSALHKAAFWGHDGTVDFLLKECKLAVNLQDYNGDTPLHDATRFGHEKIVETLLRAGANPLIKNKDGKDCFALATEYGKDAVTVILRKSKL